MISARAHLAWANHGFEAGAKIAVGEELLKWLDIANDGHDYELTDAMFERVTELLGEQDCE